MQPSWCQVPGSGWTIPQIVNQNKLLPFHSPSCVGAGRKVHVCMNIERQGECIHVCSCMYVHMYVYELAYCHAGTEATGAHGCVWCLQEFWGSDLLSSRLCIKPGRLTELSPRPSFFLVLLPVRCFITALREVTNGVCSLCRCPGSLWDSPRQAEEKYLPSPQKAYLNLIV